MSGVKSWLAEDRCQKERTSYRKSFLWTLAAGGGPCSSYFDAQGGRVAPPPRFCPRKTACAAHSHRGLEGPLGGPSATVLLIKNIDLTVPSSEGQS